MVPRTRVDDVDRRLFQPETDQVKCSINPQRIAEKPRTCCKTKEGQQDVPRDTDCFSSRNCLFQPGLRARVQRGVLVNRVDEDIDVDYDHLCIESLRLSSSSSIASATASALSQRKYCS